MNTARLICIVALLLVPSIARAEVVMRPGATGAVVVTQGQVAGGAYGSYTAGYNFELEPLLIMPELTGSIGGFGGDFTGFGARALGGLRLGATLAVEPALILRGGYGHVTLTEGPDVGLNGGAFQVGLGADYRTSRDLTFGGEVIYDITAFPVAGTTQLMHSVLFGGSVAFWL